MSTARRDGGDPEFMTAPEIAARWKMSPRFVYERIAEGTLRSCRFGAGMNARAVRVPFAAVLEFEEGASKTTPAPQRRHRLKSVRA